jgi:hypothetical protein
MSTRYGLPLTLCAVFTILYLVATAHGNQYSADSIYYRAIAENLYYRGKLYVPGDEPLVYWPPLYPLLLIPGLAFFGKYVFGLHLLCMWGVIVGWCRVANESMTGTPERAAFGFALVLSTPLLMIATFIWSEMVFLFLFTGYLFYLHRYFRAGGRRWLWVSAGFGFLMLLQRNAGIFLFAGVAAGLLVNHVRGWRGWGALKDEVLHGLLVLSGFTAWNVKKIIFDRHGHVIGELLPRVSFPRNFLLTFSELGANLLPHGVFGNALAGLALLLLVGMSYLAFYPQFDPFRCVLVTALWAYLGAWVIIPAHPDNISRFVALILPLFYFLLFDGLGKLRPHLGPLPQKILAAGVVGSFAYPLVRVVYNALFWANR